jgi:hypothetical protein
VSPDPKSCMIDRYTTGVNTLLVLYTSQISFLNFVPLHLDI